MNPTPDTKHHYYRARLDAASTRMNLAAGNYKTAAQFADDAKESWHKVRWEADLQAYLEQKS